MLGRCCLLRVRSDPEAVDLMAAPFAPRSQTIEMQLIAEHRSGTSELGLAQRCWSFQVAYTRMFRHLTTSVGLLATWGARAQYRASNVEHRFY